MKIDNDLKYVDDLKQLIIVNNIDYNKAIVTMYEKYNTKFIEILKTNAFVGKMGVTSNKKEGDGKTPLGKYKLGIAFGIHNLKDIELSKDIDYVEINKNLYWVDDINSKFYNKLVDITKTNKDWNSAEHLIDYKSQYEYAIEIKTNELNVPGNGSAIFLHCSVGKPTSGCVAINRLEMKQILQRLKKQAMIWIK